MKRLIFVCIAMVMAGMFLDQARAADSPVFWLKLDKVETERVEVKVVRGQTFLPKEKISWIYDDVKNEKSELLGKYFESVPGIVNNALLLDGMTSYIEVTEDRVPRFKGDFSIETWLAIGAYPTHLVPLVNNQHDPAIGYYNGYSLNMDALGRICFRLATKGQIEELRTTETLGMNKWFHVAAVYSENEGMKIYVDGELAASKQITGTFIPSVGMGLDQSVEDLSMLIGKSRVQTKPFGCMRPYGTQETHSFFDGLIDELKIYDEALTAKDISKSLVASVPEPALPDRTLPTGPRKAEKFGAINTTLKYYPGWDAPWHIGENADVVMRFDESDSEFIFWRGTNYIPNFVTGDGIWFNNAFDEGWNEHGSCEPMSDKRTTYSYVKIVENTDARVVVLWRYGLVDNWEVFAFRDPETGWGDWVEETYYIYPDMTGIRDNTLYSNAPRAQHEWQESIMVMGPGQRPDDVLEFGALSLANMDGEHHTYSWEHEIPPHFPPDPSHANIQMINTKSKYRPFSVVRPEDKPKIDVYSGEIRRDVCVFPWWNHWPVANKPTDGRYAQFADRPSHSSLSHWNWEAYEMTDNSVTKLMLIGLTDKKVEELLPVAKSWTNAPEIKAAGTAISGAMYNQQEKAFIIDLSGPDQNLEFEISASPESPVVNPAFVIRNWGDSDASLSIDGTEIQRGSDFRFGHHYGLEGTDLIVWIRKESNVPLKITLIPAGSN